jgi:hypothetical protein
MLNKIKKIFKSEKFSAQEGTEDFRIAKSVKKGSCGCDDGCGGC